MSLADRLRQLLGNDAVVDDSEALAAHSGDKWFAAHEPDAVVFATSTSDVTKLLKFASSEKIPVTARGGGYGYVGGCVPARGGIVLSLSQMNRITQISFLDAVAIVEPGVFTADLKAAVHAQKLFYPPDPASMKNCTIGGNVATNAGGPRCLKYGVTRNYVIGLEVVLADGEVLRTGGRVHKNKTGFDLIGLFVGSEGLLGVVTEITMKIGFAQINPTVGDLRGNCELIIGAYERLATAGAELVLTPELAITGYPPQDLVFKSRFVPENLAVLEKLHSRVGDTALLVGFVDRNHVEKALALLIYGTRETKRQGMSASRKF